MGTKRISINDLPMEFKRLQDQAPQGMANTLNTIAYKARTHAVSKEWDGQLKIRNKQQLNRTTKYTKTNKRKLKSSFGSTAYYMEKNTKPHIRSKSIQVNGKRFVLVPSKRHLTQRGIWKAYLKRAYATGQKFVVKAKSGKQVLAIRVSKGRKNLSDSSRTKGGNIKNNSLKFDDRDANILWVGTLHPHTTYNDKLFSIEETTDKIITQDVIDEAFKEGMQRAIDTRR